jgi:phosphocarrier protein HPr
VIKEEVELANETGLHARAASLFVKKASSFKSEITIVKDGKEYDGKSIMGILSMGAVKGDKILIKAEGNDEEEALKALVDLIKMDFNE